MPCSTSYFPFLTKTLLENIHRNEARGYYTKFNDSKNRILQEISSINVDYFRYLLFAEDFLIFRLCENRLGAQCLLGKHGPLNFFKTSFSYGPVKIPKNVSSTVGVNWELFVALNQCITMWS